MPVMLMNPGDEAVIRRISGGSAIRQRLAELGFISGASVQVLGSNAGCVILLVKGCRIALGSGMARHILV